MATQLTAGRVTSLAMCSSPTRASDFRPITVLSLCYRVGSSYHSKNLIASLDKWMPAGLYGSRRGGHAGMVWMNILLSIEEAHDCDIPLSGLVCDNVKAFI